MAISAEFTADFSQFTEAAKGAEAAIGGVTTASASIGVDVHKQAEIAGTAIRNFAGDVTSFAKEYIDAFAEEEKATKRLEEALKATGETSGTVIKNYQDMASTFQATTRYSDDAVIAAQTALTQIGKIAPEQMQPAIQAAADLASSLGIGLEEAAKKIGVVIGSDGAKLGTLKKYLGDVELKGKDASGILAIFNSKFGGAAAADMDTSAGRLENLQNKLDDFKGKVGEALAQALTPLLNAFTSMPDGLQTAILGLAALGAALAPLAITFGAVVTAVTPLIGLLGAGGIAGALAALAPFLLPAGVIIAGITAVYLAFKNWDAIVGFVAGVYNAIKTYLVDKFNALLGAILHPIDTVTGAFKSMYDKVVAHSYVPDMIDGIAQQFGRLQEVMVGPTLAAAGDVNEALGGIQLPGSSVGGERGARYLLSPNGQRVPMSDTGSLPDNWWDVYSGASNFASAISDLGRGGAGIGRVEIHVDGSVLSTKDELARLVGDALMGSYRTGGARLPV